MWVQLVTKPAPGGGFILERYQLDGEEFVLLPDSVSTPDTIGYILEKARMTEMEVMERRTIKVNMKMSEFQTRILSKTAGDQPHREQTVPSTSCVEGMINQLITLQEQQARQHNEFMQVIASSLSSQPRIELVKPEVFDGSNASPQNWLNFYQYACEKNKWTSDEDKVKNLRLFLEKMAKAWYELRIMEHAEGTWESWRESFLASFQENAVDRWDRAICFKYRDGSVLEYFFEKRRLLQMADFDLPESSVIPLVIHGFSTNLQRQVQVRGPKTIEDLLQACKELCVERSPILNRTNCWEQTTSHGRQFGSHPSWRPRRQHLDRNQGTRTRPINQIEFDAEQNVDNAFSQDVAKN